MLLGPAVDGRGGVVTVCKGSGDRALPPVLMPNVSGVGILAVYRMLLVVGFCFLRVLFTGYFLLLAPFFGKKFDFLLIL